MMEIILICMVVIVVGVYLIWLFKSMFETIDNPLEKYKPEHIADFVAFAKTQLHLPKVKSIKAIRQEFRHLSLMEAVEIYELANKENNN
ncbi:MAG: hypothetical protein Q4B88_05640 [Moraxella sp.]|nr:hypothetical protein [Moraxella sp.]